MTTRGPGAALVTAAEWVGVKPLIAFDLWRRVEANRHAFEPPVRNKVIPFGDRERPLKLG